MQNKFSKLAMLERYNNKENKSSTEAFVEWYKFNKICQISRKIKTKKI